MSGREVGQLKGAVPEGRTLPVRVPPETKGAWAFCEPHRQDRDGSIVTLCFLTRREGLPPGPQSSLPCRLVTRHPRQAEVIRNPVWAANVFVMTRPQTLGLVPVPEGVGVGLGGLPGWATGTGRTDPQPPEDRAAGALRVHRNRPSLDRPGAGRSRACSRRQGACAGDGSGGTRRALMTGSPLGHLRRQCPLSPVFPSEESAQPEAAW